MEREPKGGKVGNDELPIEKSLGGMNMEWDIRGIHLLDDTGMIVGCKDKAPCSECDCGKDCRVLRSCPAGRLNCEYFNNRLSTCGHPAVLRGYTRFCPFPDRGR